MIVPGISSASRMRPSASGMVPEIGHERDSGRLSGGYVSVVPARTHAQYNNRVHAGGDHVVDVGELRIAVTHRRSLDNLVAEALCFGERRRQHVLVDRHVLEAVSEPDHPAGFRLFSRLRLSDRFRLGFFCGLRLFNRFRFLYRFGLFSRLGLRRRLRLFSRFRLHWCGRGLGRRRLNGSIVVGTRRRDEPEDEQQTDPQRSCSKASHGDPPPLGRLSPSRHLHYYAYIMRAISSLSRT